MTRGKIWEHEQFNLDELADVKITARERQAGKRALGDQDLPVPDRHDAQASVDTERAVAAAFTTEIQKKR